MPSRNAQRLPPMQERGVRTAVDEMNKKNRRGQPENRRGQPTIGWFSAIDHNAQPQAVNEEVFLVWLSD